MNVIDLLVWVKKSLLSALLPIQCAGCGSWDEALCQRCAQLAKARVDSCLLALESGVEGSGDYPNREASCEDEADSSGVLPVLSLGHYRGALRRIVLAAKHSNRQDLSDFLVECGRSLGIACVDGGLIGSDVSRVVVVPAPPSWRRRLHGHSVTIPLARGVAQGIKDAAVRNQADSCVRVSVVEAVGLRVGARSQAGLTGRRRRLGREEAMRLRIRLPSDASVVLVDDVVTTGATARELRRCLGSGNVMVCLARAGEENTAASI